MDILMEELKVLAGIKESLDVEDELPKYLEEEKKKEYFKQLREQNEKKSVFTHFDVFKNKIETEMKILSEISKIFEDQNKKEFLNGLLEDKYSHLRKFADKVIIDGFEIGWDYLKENYPEIKKEIEKIEYITESEEEDKLKTYFLSEDLVSGDNIFNIEFEVYKDKAFEHKVDDIVLEYGSQLSLINDNLAILKQNGKKYFVELKSSDFKTLLDNNILV